MLSYKVFHVGKKRRDWRHRVCEERILHKFGFFFFFSLFFFLFFSFGSLPDWAKRQNSVGYAMTDKSMVDT